MRQRLERLLEQAMASSSSSDDRHPEPRVAERRAGEPDRVGRRARRGGRRAEQSRAASGSAGAGQRVPARQMERARARPPSATSSARA